LHVMSSVGPEYFFLMLSSSLISPSLGGSRKNISRSKKIIPNLPLNLDEIGNNFFKILVFYFFFDLDFFSNPPLFLCGHFDCFKETYSKWCCILSCRQVPAAIFKGLLLWSPPCPTLMKLNSLQIYETK
jgi:hypothetical protein